MVFGFKDTSLERQALGEFVNLCASVFLIFTVGHGVSHFIYGTAAPLRLITPEITLQSLDKV